MNADDTGRIPPPLPPSVQALLAHERIPPSQPEMVRARALARALEALREAPAATPTRRVALTGGWRLLVAAAATITLMAGAAAAFQMLARPAATPPRNATTARIARQVPVVPTSAELGHARPAVTTEPSSVTAPAPNHRNVVTSKREDGLVELQLLSRARQADARGNYAGVLALVAEHERTYPAGSLSEEREVLRVKALVGLSRGTEARHAAAKFRRQFPHSVLLPKIDDMLTSLR